MNLDLKVALISSSQTVNQDFKDVLTAYFSQKLQEGFDLEVFSTLPSVETSLINYGPHIIVVHIEQERKKERLEILEQLNRIALHIPVVVSCDDLDSDLMMSCVKKGVRDFIKYPYQEDEITDIIKRFFVNAAYPQQARQPGRIFTFFSYKGGIGTTFLACNTAVSIARITGARVLLWDLVMQNGDVPFFFDHQPEATLTDLLENSGKIDESYLRGVLPTHSSGVSILACPKRPEEAESIRNDDVQNLLQTLRSNYDYILIDGGHTLTDHVIGAMDSSKYILLTTHLHLPVLKNTLRCLEVFERLGYTEDKFKILLNRYNSKYEKFDLAKATDILRYPITYTFINDYFTVSRSLNTGIPVAELDKASLLAKQFNEMGELLLTNFKPKKQSGGSSLGVKIKGLFGGQKEKRMPAQTGDVASSDEQKGFNAA